MEKQRIVSAIATTGKLTLGNYLGAIKHFITLQEKHELIIFIANLHAITTNISAVDLKNNIHEMIALYFACGLDPQKTTVFLQSDVLEHTELAHILLCHTTIGELSRMTQWKDKSSKLKSNNGTEFIPTGILTYPTLMAADILLYDANLVPVGKDQKQHIELTRNIAERMNNKYQANLFTLPEEYISPVGNKIMDLQNPLQKMSKSSTNLKSFISLFDKPEEVNKKIKQAVTDSEGIVKYDVEKKPGISNLIMIHAALQNLNIQTAEKQVSSLKYDQLKNLISDEINILLNTIQKSYNLLNKTEIISSWLNKGAEKARKIANKKLNIVKSAIGLNY